MAQRRVLFAWLAVVLAVIVLYTWVPATFFNDGSARIAGMPEMLFWYTVLPFVIPGVMAVLYVYDARSSRRARADQPHTERRSS
jgi:hypothetical protein